MEKTVAVNLIKNKKSTKKNRQFRRNIIGIICLAIFLPIVILNLTVLITALATNGAPSFFGVTPILEKSSAMDGSGIVQKGDLVFIKETDISSLHVGDVIGYKIGEIIYIRRIVSIDENVNQETVFVTKGDNKIRRDNANVMEDQIIGTVNLSIKGLGNFVDFAQSPFGIALFVGGPISAYLLYDIIRGILYNKNMKKNAQNKPEQETLLADKEIADNCAETKPTEVVLAEDKTVELSLAEDKVSKVSLTEEKTVETNSAEEKEAESKTKTENNIGKVSPVFEN